MGNRVASAVCGCQGKLEQQRGGRGGNADAGLDSLVLSLLGS